MLATSRTALLAAVFAVGLTACSSDSPTGVNASAGNVDASKGGSSAVGTSAGRKAGQFEVPYMEFAIDHHAMGVMMATLCIEKAVHAELRELCRMNLENQRREIQQLQAWLQAWYGISYEPQIQPGDERMMEKLAALPPAEFEMEFLEMFSQHHWIIIHRSISIARDAMHEDLEEMARNIITNQYADVAKMRTWLCEWYGKCLPVPPLPPI